LNESADVEWMVYSGRAGGSIGVGWVLILQPEVCQLTFKIYATNYSILQYGILDVRVPVCMYQPNKNTQRFGCIMCRLEGAFEVLIMIIIHSVRDNWILKIM